MEEINREKGKAHGLQGVCDQLGDDAAAGAGQAVDERVRHHRLLHFPTNPEGEREREQGLRHCLRPRKGPGVFDH